MQGGEQRLRTQAGLFTFGYVDIDHILRVERVERAVGHCDLRTLVQLADELLRDVEERVDVAARFVLQVHFETVRGAVTRDHRRSEDKYLGVFDQVARLHGQHTHDRIDVLFLGTFFPRLEFTDKRTVGATLSGHETVSGDFGTAFQTRGGCEQTVYPSHGGLCLFQRSCRRHTHGDEESTGIFVRHHTRRSDFHQAEQNDHRSDDQAESEPFPFDEQVDAFFVLGQRDVVSDVEGFMEPFDRAQFFLSLFLFLVRFQEHGAQRRTQRQRVDGGQADGDGHRQTELAVERTRRTGDEAYRNEHGHHHEGDRHDSSRNFAHRVDRRFQRRFITLIQFGMYRLDDHDGIIDDNTDGKY